MLRYIPLIIALSIGPAFAADLAAKKDKTTTDKTTTETTDTTKEMTSKDVAEAKKHKCAEGEKWVKSCVNHDKKGEKCTKIGGSCQEFPDEPALAPTPEPDAK